MAGKASVFLAYLEATCSAEPFFPAGPPKVRIAPNGASCCLLANSAWLSLKKMVQCTCFPFWEPFHVLFSVLQLCTCKLSLLLGRGAGSLVRALDPSGREEVGWMWVCTVTPPHWPLSTRPRKLWHAFIVFPASKLPGWLWALQAKLQLLAPDPTCRESGELSCHSRPVVL